MDSYFAPPERTDRRLFRNQIQSISRNPLMSTLLKTMSGLLVVLNEDRQIVSMNHEFLNALNISDPEEALGLRLGESLHCKHAEQPPGGCGTTPYCVTCGAAIAMMTAIWEGKTDEQICAITREHNGVTDDLLLIVKAQPITIDNNRWIIILARDITQQQFWMNLENVFFHDINNLLSSLLGNAYLLTMDQPDNSAARKIRASVERLSSEVAIQRSLSNHKETQYLIRNINVSLSDIRKEVHLIIDGNEVSKNKTIKESWPDQEISLTTDILLVSRIISNMIVNALEASSENDTIKITTTVDPDRVLWKIWNRDSIPEPIQKRIFQRNFSTKATAGRGLGTYSMKLFGEKFLNGSVSFTSSDEDGTLFEFSLPRSQ